MSDGLRHHEQVNLGGMLPDGGGDEADQTTLKEFRQVEDWWAQARINQHEMRLEMAKDEDFYDGLQWSDEDALVLEQRGQAPLVFNQVAPVINWMTGTERRAKVDFHVYPRTEDDRDAATVKTKLLKYLSDVNHTRFLRSAAFKDATIAGVAWLEDGVRNDPTKEPIYGAIETWRNIWPDMMFREPDGYDMRYLFRARWVDEDIGVAMFYDKRDAIHRAAQSADLFSDRADDAYGASLYYRTDDRGYPMGSTSIMGDVGGLLVNNRRSRVRLAEAWYRKPMARQIMRVHDATIPEYGQANGEVYDPANELHAALAAQGYASVYNAIRLEMRNCIFVDGTPLQMTSSPYRHQAYPFTPVIAYRRRRDGSFYGAVRNMRDPQEDLNKRRSKGLHLLSSNQVVAEEDAVEDIDEAREQAADPNGWITVRRGKKVEFRDDKRDVAAHMQYETLDREMVRETGGINSDNLGQESNAHSGVAIKARQAEGSITTTELYDNLHYAVQRQGEKQLSMIEQYMPAPKQIRIVSDRGAQEFLNINTVGTGPNGEPVVENDITATQADFVIDTVEYNTTIRQAMQEQLMDMVGDLAKMGPVGAQVIGSILDLIMDGIDDLSHREEIVRRIRKITGQIDPAMEGTPEQQQAEQQQQAAEAEAAALNKRAIEAKIAVDEAKAAQTKQAAIQEAATTLATLLTAGKELVVTPAMATMVDELRAWVEQTAAGAPPLETPNANPPVPPIAAAPAPAQSAPVM